MVKYASILLFTKSLHVQCRILSSKSKGKLTTLQDSIIHFGSEKVNRLWTKSLFILVSIIVKKIFLETIWLFLYVITY